jgi:acyl dehydratase
MTVYMDELEAGRTFISDGRTITETDLVVFSGVSGDFSPLHIDEQWVLENTSFRGRIAHGLLITSITSGLHTPVLADVEVIAYLEFSRTLGAPVYIGDTIRAHWKVTESRRSRSRPERGIVTFEIEVRNQDGTAVQHGTDVWLVSAGGNGAAPDA